MITTRRTTRLRPASAGLATAAAVALVVLPVGAPPSTAREALPSTSESSSAGDLWYAAPLAGLGDRTLAQYLADHEARVIGPSPV
jgi:hypothetical protein